MTRHSAEALGIEVADIDRRLADNWSLPTRFYWDSDIFEFEMEAIFAKRWQFFCPVHKVMNPGDVAVRKVGRFPIVVTRDRNGELHGFLNICRHRGYTVAERDQTKCARLVCRYHAWSYNLDGSLANAPDAAGEQGFCGKDLGLMPVKVDTWGAAVLIHPYPQAASLRETYPRMFATAAEIGFDVDPANYAMAREITYDVGTNWKLWYDNGTECYHCPFIHGSSFGDAFSVRTEDTNIRIDESFTSYSFRANPNPKVNGLAAEGYMSFQLFPGMAYIIHDDLLHFSGMTPIAPGVTRHSTWYLAENEADPARVEGWIKIWNDTYREDNEATAVQYENLKSARQPWNRYVSNREYAAQHISNVIWADYKAALAA